MLDRLKVWLLITLIYILNISNNNKKAVVS